MTGLVVAVDEVSCRVRVEFPDRDDGNGTNLVSDWLPVLQDFCVGNEQYRLPDENTQVVCLMDERCEAGVVLGAIYSDADPPPVTDRNLFYRRFLDGTVIQYDRAGHKLSATVQGEVDVTATGMIKTTAAQGQQHDGGSGKLNGAVQGDCLCAFTGSPHPMISGNVKLSL